jgi:hypothetical protein
MYEIREGEVKGWFCGRYCYDKAKEEFEEGKKDPLVKKKGTDASWW